MQAEKSKLKKKGLAARPALNCHEDVEGHVSDVHPEHSGFEELPVEESDATGCDALFFFR